MRAEFAECSAAASISKCAFVGLNHPALPLCTASAGDQHAEISPALFASTSSKAVGGMCRDVLIDLIEDIKTAEATAGRMRPHVWTHAARAVTDPSVLAAVAWLESLSEESRCGAAHQTNRLPSQSPAELTDAAS
jgi:hypothetical protein